MKAMKHSIWALPLIVGAMLASIHLLPNAGAMQPSAVEMDLPPARGQWLFRTQPPSKAETEILAEDTRFSKAICLTARDGAIDIGTGMQLPDHMPHRVDLSIVLSGHDLNNSIHRPERCMPSQGHTIFSSSPHTVKLDNGRSLPFTRLVSVQTIPTNEEHTEHIKLNCVTYYFFVGNNRVTRDHLERTLLDMKDRLFRGVDQHWAYVSASMWYGKLPWSDKEVTIGEADAEMNRFVSELGTEQIDWSMIRK